MFLLQGVPPKRWSSLQIPTTWWCCREANIMIATVLAGSWFRSYFATKQLKVECWKLLLSSPCHWRLSFFMINFCFSSSVTMIDDECILQSWRLRVSSNFSTVSPCQTIYPFLPTLWRLSTTAALTSLLAARSWTSTRPSANTTVLNPIPVPPCWPLILTSIWLTRTWNETNRQGGHRERLSHHSEPHWGQLLAWFRAARLG